MAFNTHYKGLKYCEWKLNLIMNKKENYYTLFDSFLAFSGCSCVIRKSWLEVIEGCSENIFLVN